MIISKDHLTALLIEAYIQGIAHEKGCYPLPQQISEIMERAKPYAVNTAFTVDVNLRRPSGAVAK